MRLADRRLSLSPRAPATLRLAKLSWADDVRINGLEVRVPPARIRCSAPRWRTVECSGSSTRASLPTFEVTASAGKSPLRLTAEAAELAFELAGEGQGLYSGRVVLSDGAVRAPAHQLRLSGIAADVHLSVAADPAANPVSIASIAHEGAPPWFARCA